MNVLSLQELEQQVRSLSTDKQLSLLERLVQDLRRRASAADLAWQDDLAAMAADPQIRTEVQKIDQEFSGAEADGLESF